MRKNPFNRDLLLNILKNSKGIVSALEIKRRDRNNNIN